ncbi:small multidrug resistance protein [Thiorhodococcus drewsii AZ1]|uniref:Guanidinium exporter n=1 Tax=Thiorhodococcus drewsii AZ1 TaxID=765913 RepID=G2E139_9GAMM|nr:small multidrug resistance protein [Thiorhodococcus drewsii AZ1]
MSPSANSLAWIYLAIAGACEWGWPVGLKYGLSPTGLRWSWILFAILCMTASGAFLLLAQKTIPMGTAYAVWTGIGAVGAFSLGILLFAEPATLARFFFVGLIIAGIAGLKLTSSH